MAPGAGLPQRLLRAGVLDGVRMLHVGAAGARASAAVREGCAALGASVHALDAEVGAAGVSELELVREEAIEAAVTEVLEREGDLEMLVVDAAGLYAAAARAGGDAAAREGGEPAAALRACMEIAWTATHAVVGAAFLERGHGGRIVYVTPPAGAGDHAAAARAGLENLARTLSVEWARHAITAVAVAPGADAGEVAALVAYLASPAGAYFSGCLLDLEARALQ